MRSDRKVIQARYHRGKAAITAIAFALILVGSATLFLDAFEQDGGATWLGRRAIVYGALFAVTSAIALPAAIRRLWLRDPVLVFDWHGFKDSRWSADKIPWQAIARAQGKRKYAQYSLSIWLSKPEAWPARSATARFVSRLNRRSGGGDLSIPLSGLDIAPLHLFQEFEKFRAQQRGQTRA